MASTTDDTRDGLLRAEYGVENDTYYYLGTQLVARKRSGLRPDLIFLSGFEALLPRALAKRLVEALVGLKSGGESVTWFLTDHLGSNIATVDAAGAVIERSQFAPYGERWGKVAERGPGFTGHYEDQSTLTYMKARYYGGIVGRFLSPDPVLTDTADGRNFNRYWYANNNPQKFVDPDGRLPILIPVAIFVAKELASEAVEQATGIPLPTLKNAGKIVLRQAAREARRGTLQRSVREGARRQREVTQQLRAENPNASIQNEQFLTGC